MATLALGIYGIGRSLWLDEAWVANSILSPSLSGMFYYPDWLQSTPPLFLLLTRAAVHLFGASNSVFRLIPLAFALLAVTGMMALSRRLLSAPFAALACTLLAFHPTVIEYSRTCKQYSGELACAGAILLCAFFYLQNPLPSRFYWLTAVFVLALPLAWAAVFLLPGVVLAVWARGGIRRAGSLLLVCGGLLGILYFVFIRPNLTPQLRTFWIATALKPSPGMLAAGLFCVAAAVKTVLTIRENPNARASVQIWIQVVALLPCFLLAVADLLHWYPPNPRTRLFVLPGFLLVVAMNAEDLFRQVFNIPSLRRTTVFVGAAVWVLAAGVGFEAVWRQVSEHQNRPQEDFAGAVQYLRQHLRPSDLLLVHPSVLEGFKLYANMQGWHDHRAIYGNTGWPCCARDRNATPNSSTAEAVSDDLDRKVPHGFPGRIWLFYSARHTHWAYVGYDEGVLWRNYLSERGCPPTGPYLVLQNIAISAMDCAKPEP